MDNEIKNGDLPARPVPNGADKREGALICVLSKIKKLKRR